METIVERAGQQDIPLLVELMRQFYDEANYPLERGWAQESFGKLFEANGRAWIARLDGKPAGYVVLTLRHSMEYGTLVGFIDDLFVRPGARRTGVASALLAALFDECRHLQVAAVHVESGASNTASGAPYRKFGLVPYTDDRQVLTTRLLSAP
jgi:GNAT superfamily N-acetyltransferase